MKTLKKVIIIVLTAVMLTSALSLSAAAAVGAGAKVQNIEEIKFQLAQSIAAEANAKIEKFVAQFQAKPNPNIHALITVTNNIASKAIAAINALGFDAVCEYVTYEVGGQLVEIDPIIVIPIGED